MASVLCMRYSLLACLFFLLAACKQQPSTSPQVDAHCSSKLPYTDKDCAATTSLLTFNAVVPDTQRMVPVKGGMFLMGNEQDVMLAGKDEQPAHEVKVADFYLDSAEVSVADFAAFVDATGYVTTA